MSVASGAPYTTPTDRRPCRRQPSVAHRQTEHPVRTPTHGRRNTLIDVWSVCVVERDPEKGGQTNQSAAGRDESIMPLSVYFYVPNLIGYARVALAFVGYALAPTQPELTFGTYMLSQLLDAADGYAARALKQSSIRCRPWHGDRPCITTCLCVVLPIFTHSTPWCSPLVTLDMFSHWFHMYASLLQGGSHRGHESAAALLQETSLFIMCSATRACTRRTCCTL